MSSEIIKTTAKYQEANEPIKQKPIIQIERPLPNTIKASLDGGRDNPFRPDGEIYKSANPIVDYYKYGPNQSRAQSPTDSQLLLGLNAPASEADDKQVDKKNKKKKRAKRKTDHEEDGDSNNKRRSCFSRWFCCCCHCNWCSKSKQNNDNQQQTEHIEGNHLTNGSSADREALGQYEAPPAVDTKTKEFKQTKIVVLMDADDCDEDPELIGIQDQTETSRNQQSQTTGNEKVEESSSKGGQLKGAQTNKSRSSRCVIS